VFEITTMKLTKPWTGKKDNLPSPAKKEQHKDRKSKEELVHRWQEDDWEIQLEEFNASQQIQE